MDSPFFPDTPVDEPQHTTLATKERSSFRHDRDRSSV